jgi:Holliday junction resolvase RusA-like endonuclease
MARMCGSTAGQLGGLIIDLPPRELHPNARAHWRAQAKAKGSYRPRSAELLWAQLHERDVDAPLWVRAIIQLDFYHPRGPFQDPDNALAWAKTAIDAMQDAKILADDREIIYLPPGQFIDKLRPRLEIGVRELVPMRCPLCGGRNGGP